MTGLAVEGRSVSDSSTEACLIQKRQLVDAAKFLHLAISCRRLVRMDLPEEGLCGLLDPDAGVLFTTPADDLFVR